MKNIQKYHNRQYAKKLIVASLVCPIVFFGSGCKKTIETKPYSYFSSANFFTNVDEAYMATLGVYEIMSSLETYGWNINMLFDTDTDIGQVSGLSSDDYRVIPHYQGIPESATFYTVWSDFYKGIDRANVVIESIPKMTQYTNGTTDQKAALNRMLGEALFLRGFYYAELIRLWGDVPFKTSSSKAGTDLSIGLTDRYEIYAQIIKDMETAADLLPADMPVDERVNKWACKAMLARVALFAGGYSLRSDGKMTREEDYKKYYKIAQQQINDVMAANVYHLNPDYCQVFKNQCQHVLDPTENIFQVAFYNPAGQRGNSSWIGYWNAPSTKKGIYAATGTRYMTIRPFYESFQADDQRKDFAIARFNIDANGNRNYLVSGRQDEQWTPGKWSREYQTGDITESAYTHINYVVMRYADLLLMRAEVENELNGGPNEIALDAINQVRRRAYGLDNPGSGLELSITQKGSGYTKMPTVQITGGGGNYCAGAITALNKSDGSLRTLTEYNVGQQYTSVPTVTLVGGDGSGAEVTASLIPKPSTEQIYLKPGLMQQQFLDTIMEERAKELCFEGMRRADLIRWNVLGEKIKATYDSVQQIRSNYFYPAYTNFVAGKHELYPLPQNETDVNKAITRQNPGY